MENPTCETRLETLPRTSTRGEEAAGCRRCSSGDPEGIVAYQVLVLQAHKDYCRKETEQFTLLEDGSFSRSLAVLIYEMPGAHTLQIVDSIDRDNDSPGPPTLNQVRNIVMDDEKLRKSLTQTRHPWNSCSLDSSGLPPFENQIPRVLAALGICPATTTITSLNISISTVQNVENLATTADQRKQINSLNKGLQTLKIRIHCGEQRNRTDLEDLTTWQALLSALLRGSNGLRSVTLQLGLVPGWRYIDDNIDDPRRPKRHL